MCIAVLDSYWQVYNFHYIKEARFVQLHDLPRLEGV